MKKLLILLLITGCNNLTTIQKTEKKKMRREKCVVLTAMAVHAVGFKIIADKQTAIK